MDVKALIFDVNGTLINIETDEWMEEIYRAIGHFLLYQGIRLHRGEVRDLYFQIMKEQFATCDETYHEFDVVAVWRTLLVQHASKHTRLLPEAKWEQLPLFLAELQRGISRKHLCLFPQVREVLDLMRQRYRLAIVTDAQSAYAVPELRAVGIYHYFNPIIVSGDFGYRKPDIRLFRKALNVLQVQPEQAVFIGNDRFRDIFGAQQAGMKTILYLSGSSNGSSHEAEPDYIVHAFSELPQILEFIS